VEAQQGTFDTALAELCAGAKRSHWMWFIFPQLRGLGRSPTALHFAIASLDEARAYLDHPLLGSRLGQCVHAVLPYSGTLTPEEIFGAIDALKFRSSLTLFDQVDASGQFAEALVEFFDAKPDEQTLALLNARH